MERLRKRDIEGLEDSVIPFRQLVGRDGEDLCVQVALDAFGCPSYPFVRDKQECSRMSQDQAIRTMKSA